MPDHVEIGERIKRIRKRKGLTQATLAEQAGISDTYMGYVENGKKCASLSVLSRIAAALGTTVSELIKLEDDPLQGVTANISLIVEDCSDNEKSVICAVANTVKEAVRKYLI